MQSAARKLKISLHALMIDFENRDLGLLGVARIGISFASWSFAIALGVYGFEAHGVVGVGLVALIRLLPGAIASPFCGLLADRNSRRDVLGVSSVVMAMVLAGAAFASSQNASTDVVFIFPALYAIALAAYVPAEAALFPVLARTPQELSASNVNHVAMENAGFIVAAIATGFLLTATSPGTVFAVAAGVTALVAVLLLAVKHDRRPEYAEEEDVSGVLREVSRGARGLRENPGLRLASLTLVVLLLFEGLADVILVTLALHLLHLEEGSVGFLNAAWGVGALVGGASLALLLDRGQLVVAIAGGSLLIGAATLLPGFWPEETTSYLGWFGIGIGFTFVEVAAKTLMHRLGDDETMGRLTGALESGRLAAQALGSILAIVLVELLHPDGALIVVGRKFEIGAPVAEEQYQLLRGNSIFAPLPIATVERLSHDLVAVETPAGQDVIVQGDIGDRFYLIEEGQVEVFEHGEFRRHEGPGESFGEIALLHDVPRTATVRTTVDTRLLALEREQFLLAVTGHRRSQQRAHSVSEERWIVRS
jgi:MFS family permease